MNYYCGTVDAGDQYDKGLSYGKSCWFGQTKSGNTGIKKDDIIFLKKDKEIKGIGIAIEDPKHSDGEFYNMRFEKLLVFDNPISLGKFQLLKMFIVDVNLLHNISYNTKKGFMELKIIDSKMAEAIEQLQSKDKEKNNQGKKYIIDYVNDEANYRKVIIYKSRDKVSIESQDIQLYLEQVLLFSKPFHVVQTFLRHK